LDGRTAIPHSVLQYTHSKIAEVENGDFQSLCLRNSFDIKPKLLHDDVYLSCLHTVPAVVVVVITLAVVVGARVVPVAVKNFVTVVEKFVLSVIIRLTANTYVTDFFRNCKMRVIHLFRVPFRMI